MKKEQFIKLIRLIQQRDIYTDKLYGLGIALFDTELMDCVYKSERLLLEEIYGKAGYEWIDWWLYDKPEGEVGAWDENNNPICNTIEELWVYLENNHIKLTKKILRDKK